MKTMRAAEVVLDFDLYPRNNLDSSNVSNIAEAISAGIEVPPVVIDRKSKRCIDGFHRIKAMLRLHGEEAEITVVEKEYKTEREMFLDAMRYNSTHGAKLDSCDRTRCALIAERLHISADMTAKALNMTVTSLKHLRLTRTAETGPMRNKTEIPLKRTIAGNMAGKTLTKEQAEVNDRLSGMNQSFYANQLIMLIETDMLDTEDEKLMKRLEKLHGLLETVLAVK
jgi:hypothetical protein